MEWDATNTKIPLQWEDWGDPTLFNNKNKEARDFPQQQHYLHSPKFGVAIPPSSHRWGHDGGCSSSRGSISASINSTPNAGGRAPVSILEGVQVLPEDLAKKKGVAIAEDTGRSSPEQLVPSFGSGELMIGLKLGKRTYFEESVFAGGNNTKASCSAAAPLPPTTSVKKCRASNQSMQGSRCQVEGCSLDLTKAKDYHRKHRVCESHSKCAKVVVAGRERRFCQQCSRFHDLSEFDQKKRSCRRRLSDHNARRRKPTPDAMSFNSAELSSSSYDDRQQTDLPFNRVLFSHVKPAGESSFEFKFGQRKGSWISFTKAGGTGGQLQIPSNDLSTTASTFHHGLDRMLPFKDTTAGVLNQGPDASDGASSVNGASDLRRALSLLSTESLGTASDAGPTSLQQLARVNYTSAAQPASSNYHSPHETPVLPFIWDGHGRQMQELQRLKCPYETGLVYSNEIR